MKTMQENTLLARLSNLKGKVKYTHSSQYDGRRQSVALMKIGGQYFQGTATLSDKDVFSRKLGRVIALGRAFKMYEAGRAIVPQEQWKFKEDRKGETDGKA